MVLHERGRVASTMKHADYVQRTYRVLACLCLQCNALLCLILKDKEPSHETVAHRSFKRTHVSDLLRNPLFTTWTIAAVVQLLGYFVPLYYLPGEKRASDCAQNC